MTNDDASPAEPKFIPLDFARLTPDEQLARSETFYELMRRRRTVRDYCDEDVPLELIERGETFRIWRMIFLLKPGAAS